MATWTRKLPLQPHITCPTTLTPLPPSHALLTAHSMTPSPARTCPSMTHNRLLRCGVSPPWYCLKRPSLGRALPPRQTAPSVVYFTSSTTDTNTSSIRISTTNSNFNQLKAEEEEGKADK